MRRRSILLLGFGIGYSLLFLLSIMFIVPRYLHGGLGGFLLALITDTEPEGRLTISFLRPLIWILIPFASVTFCVLSGAAYGVSPKSRGLFSKFARLGGALFFVASFVPAILVVRELLIYHTFGVTSPDVVNLLTNFAHVFRGIMSPTAILGSGRGWVVPIVIFAETGLFFGFFLPGDSLLVTIGVLASVGRANLALLIPFTILGAILGGQLSYAIGRQSGEALSLRYRFVQDNVQRASEFYSKYGGKAIILARFVPVVRTFAPLVGGAARMSYSRFTIANVTGGALWVVSVTLAGYFVGSLVPNVTYYLNPLILIVILSSPLVWILAWFWGRYEPKRLHGK